MNVRTITAGVPLARLNDADVEPRLQGVFGTIRSELAAKDIAVRTCRLMLSPIGEEGEQRVNQARAIGLVKSLAQLSERLDIRWFNVPFDLTRRVHADTLDGLTETALEVVRRFPRSFVHLICASGGRIDHDAISKTARFIKQVAALEPSGYPNFRVGAGCNIRPDTPFFPFAYSSDELGFSLGLEMPQELIKLVGGMTGWPLTRIRDSLLETLPGHLTRIQDIAERAAAEHGATFRGIDVSIAPYPETGGSVAQLIEMLGVEQYGAHGTLFVIAYLTDLIKELVRRGNLRTTGFNGVMLSLLEDDVMGRRNNAGTYSIDSLILYSTMCGCGIDMVPIPGDTFEEEIASMILDVATVSTVLAKPLGVRVLPIPMKLEHELTSFNMDFLFNTRIKKMRNLGFVGGRLPGAFELLRKS